MIEIVEGIAAAALGSGIVCALAWLFSDVKWAPRLLLVNAGVFVGCFLAWRDLKHAQVEHPVQPRVVAAQRMYCTPNVSGCSSMEDVMMLEIFADSVCYIPYNKGESIRCDEAR